VFLRAAVPPAAVSSIQTNRKTPLRLNEMKRGEGETYTAISDPTIGI
jgi:hypothetical protein